MRYQVVRRKEEHRGNDEYAVLDYVVGSFEGKGDAYLFISLMNYWMWNGVNYVDHYILDKETGEITTHRNTPEMAKSIVDHVSYVATTLKETANVR